MKKFLILMLVLGVATAANAALIDSWSDGLGVTWQVTTDIDGSLDLLGTGAAATTYGGYGIYLHEGGYVNSWITPSPAASGLLGKNGLYDAAGDLGDNSGPDIYGGYFIQAKDGNGSVAPNLAAGDWFLFDISSSAPGTAKLEIYGQADTIITLPEPMTIVLLGLGGLFLRRRKA
jgi:hypothetical protein